MGKKIMRFLTFIIVFSCLTFTTILEAGNDAEGLQELFVDVVEKVGPAVVSITVEQIERRAVTRRYSNSPFDDEFFNEFFREFFGDFYFIIFGQNDTGLLLSVPQGNIMNFDSLGRIKVLCDFL